MSTTLLHADTHSADLSHFSIFLGGPLYQLYRRMHLSGEGLEHARRRVIVLSLFAWLPLLVLALFEGVAWSGSRQPFLLDVEVHARLLIALPLMVWGELFVHERMGLAVGEFLKCGLVTPAGMPRFEAAAVFASRLRNLPWVEAALLAFVYGVGVAIIWRGMVALDTDIWYRQRLGNTSHATLAGWWYALVSLPLFQFILYRWYFRLGVWTWFLYKVSRTGLDLVPTHPDRCGGLGFLGQLSWAFMPLLLAQGVLLAGVAASGIFFDGRTLPEYWPALALLAVLVLGIAWGPVLAFVPILIGVRFRGLREYGALGQRYARDFDRKWVRGEGPADEPLLGSADIQSLADLGNSYQVIEDMRMIPVSWKMTLRLAAVAVAPIAPLLFTLISARDLLKLILQGLG